MSCDPVQTKARPIRLRRTISDRLSEALIGLSGGHAKILAHKEQPWASITFSGARHDFTLEFSGAQAVQAGEEFVVMLGEHEFTIPGQLVADATVVSLDHQTRPEPRIEIEASLLLLEDV